jgi:hypothetical protein
MKTLVICQTGIFTVKVPDDLLMDWPSVREWLDRNCGWPDMSDYEWADEATVEEVGGLRVEPAAGKYHIALYLEDRAYGGPEEGGWWYDCGVVVADGSEAAFNKAFDTEKEALEHMAKHLEAVAEMNKGRREISSVLSEGEYHLRITEELPADFPSETPHYE